MRKTTTPSPRSASESDIPIIAGLMIILCLLGLVAKTMA